MQDYAKHNTQNIDVIYNSLEQLYSQKKAKKISKRSRLRGSLGRGKATEPGDMPLMSMICPPVIEFQQVITNLSKRGK